MITIRRAQPSDVPSTVALNPVLLQEDAGQRDSFINLNGNASTATPILRAILMPIQASSFSPSPPNVW